MAAYHNKTLSGADAGQGLAPAVSNGATGRADNIRPYAPSYGGKPKQVKSSFEQWNIEKTQPQLSYAQERLIQTYPSGGSWIDTTLRNAATRQRQGASDVDKSLNEGYNNSVGANHDSPVYGNAQAMPSLSKGGGTTERGGRIPFDSAYDRQMSYRGLQRNTYDNSKPTGRKRELENSLNASSLYNPKEQQEIVKEGLDTAQRRLNSRTYAHYSDAYDKEEEALNYLTDSIVYGSDLDDNTVWSWVTKQGEGEEWLVSLFGEEKREELSKRLQQKLNAVTPEVKQKNAYKYKDYTSKDFDLPDAEKYKKEHNIGGEDEELDTWSTVLDVLQAGLDAAGVIPGVGVAPDVINAAIYAMRGEWKNAGFSAVAALPVVGYLGTGAKYALKAIDKIADVTKYVDKASDGLKVLGGLGGGAGLLGGILKYGDEFVDAGKGVAKYGDEVAEAIAKNADNAADISKTAGNAADISKTAGNAAEASKDVVKRTGKGTKQIGVDDTKINKKPYAKSRPSYATGQEEEVWRMYADPETDTVIDPSGEVITWDRTKPRKGQWDMGHIPGQKYSDMRNKYLKDEISKEEFLEWYRNPKNYRPELPKTNRSHKFE